MNKQVIEKWATALESGDYAQGKSRLHTITEKGNSEFCCLGVLCELAKDAGVVEIVGQKREGGGPFYNEDTNTHEMSGGFTRVFYGFKDDELEAYALPDSVAEWAGLAVDGVMDADPTLSHPAGGHHAASYWNDVEKVSFSDIAAMIRHTYLEDTDNN